MNNLTIDLNNTQHPIVKEGVVVYNATDANDPWERKFIVKCDNVSEDYDLYVEVISDFLQPELGDTVMIQQTVSTGVVWRLTGMIQEKDYDINEHIVRPIT